jgi:hypothetical protein
VKYLPNLQNALGGLESRHPPSNAAELLDAMLIRWDPGSRSKSIAAQNLALFLNSCTQWLHFKSCWMPETKLAAHEEQRP